MNYKELKVHDIIIFRPTNTRFVVLEINVATVKIECREKEFTTYVSNWLINKDFRLPTKLERALT